LAGQLTIAARRPRSSILVLHAPRTKTTTLLVHDDTSATSWRTDSFSSSTSRFRSTLDASPPSARALVLVIPIRLSVLGMVVEHLDLDFVLGVSSKLVLRARAAHACSSTQSVSRSVRRR
jgi:hypothetical protein